jgi:hypothetical protein
MVSSSVSFPDEGAEPRAAALEKAPSRRIEVLLVAAAAVGLSFAAYRVQVQAHSRHAWAAAQVTVASAFVVAGLVAWLRRPTNRLGPLMLATGVAYLARQLRYSQDALLFTVFFLLGDLAFALAGHSILAYPSGRVHGRAPRLLVKAGYTAVLAFPFAVLLLHRRRYPLLAMGPLPPRSLLGLGDNPRAVELLQKSEIVVFFGVLASMFVAVIVQRLLQATPRARRVLAPLLLAAVAIALRAVYECVHTFVNRQPFAYSYLFWWQVAAFIALPLALLAGMLRARLARANIGELVVELDRAPATPRRLRDALARTLADPSLELYFWLPERAEWVDAGGNMVSLPDAGPRRAVPGSSTTASRSRRSCTIRPYSTSRSWSRRPVRPPGLRSKTRACTRRRAPSYNRYASRGDESSRPQTRSVAGSSATSTTALNSASSPLRSSSATRSDASATEPSQGSSSSSRPRSKSCRPPSRSCACSPAACTRPCSPNTV